MPRTGYRLEQINEFLRVEVAELLRQERDELKVGMVSIIEVQTSPDLRHARVFVSTLGGEAEREVAVAALRRHARHLRRLLAPRITFRSVPELDFRADGSLESGDAVSRALREVEALREGMPEDLAPLPDPVTDPPRVNPRARKRSR